LSWNIICGIVDVEISIEEEEEIAKKSIKKEICKFDINTYCSQYQ